jgi:hypothetical protein
MLFYFFQVLAVSLGVLSGCMSCIDTEGIRYAVPARCFHDSLRCRADGVSAGHVVGAKAAMVY